MDKEQQGIKSVSVRTPLGLLADMHKVAKQHKRSLNGEILQALQEYTEKHLPQKESQHEQN